MTSTNLSRLPRLLPGTDLRGLPISPADAFVLSRLDGTTTIEEIAEETGKSVQEVTALLERLATLGAVALGEPAPAPERRKSPPSAHRPSGNLRIAPIVQTNTRSYHQNPAPTLYDPAELEEDVDIDWARRRHILDLYYRLDQLDHYQLFGVAPNADKKAIKASYFEVVNLFHPDRYYGKKVGGFGAKLERVFSRLTDSYNVLSRKASRAEYDAYLQARNKTRALDAAQTDSALHQAALAEVMLRIQAEAGAESRAGSPRPPTVTSNAPASSPQPLGASERPASGSAPPSPPAEQSGARPSASLRPSDPESRRRALARKLGKVAQSESERAAAEVTAARERAEISEQDAVRKDWAADELKRRYQDRMQAARVRQVEVYTRAAALALEKGDHVGAANALRIATSLAPDDSALAAQLSEVSGQAKRDLASSYLEQAEYEERSENWLAAAKSYARALYGRPEARIYERFAHCLLSGEGDLREAGEAAKRAVMLQPDSAGFRVTLARFYAKAGMRQSAEGELSRAATLAPTDDKVNDWIRRLKRELG